ncbi:MAG: hypothetical protein Q9187_001066 [Circinaria calcarea]
MQAHTTEGESNVDGLTASRYPLKSTEAWRVLFSWLDPLSEDASFWWQTTGPFLGMLLSEAGYNLHSQYEGLLFYRHFIATNLGAQPTNDGEPRKWRSYMTDDYSPVEFSWNWNNSTRPPKIRCTIEAIPSNTESIDAFNQAKTMEVVHQLQVALPYIDWHLFNYFASTFSAHGISASGEGTQGPARNHQSSMFLGFEFEGDKVAVKAYFAPAVQVGESCWDAVYPSIKGLEQGSMRFPALDELSNFLAASPEGRLLDVEGLAIDCISPSQSRLKVYARSPLTSFDSVWTYMTMGGKLSRSEKVRRELSDLWRLVLELDRSFSSSESLPLKTDRTAGIMYNYDIRAGTIMPEPKIYINTRHYGQNDLSIAQGLASFMMKYHRADDIAGYWRVIDGFCTYRNLDRECGIQTYISCAIQGDSLSLTSYLSPQVYHRARCI